ncbi:MAG: serine hydrolase, partial [Cyclobacteriaceae bacterium]
KDTYEVQVIYTQINRDEQNNPSFNTFEFNTDDHRYFYPASTVKMPVALLALEKLNELSIKGIDRNTTMLTDSAYSGQTAVIEDSTSENGKPSVAHYVRKIFVVSDNDAFNRLHEFVGPGEVRIKLRNKGFDDSRIIHRLSVALSEDENRHTNPVRFIQGDSVLYSQAGKFYEGELDTEPGLLRGEGYISNGELINEPMEFGSKNFIPLNELNGMLQRIIFPESFEPSERFSVTKDDLKFVWKCMSQLPGETAYPAYPEDEYFDAYSKFLLYGSDSTVKIPPHIRIFNKIGLAYGFVTDVAYIVDLEKNIEFMLAATIHTNRNRIYNDGEYEYEETAFPFLRDLGQLIYNYEQERSRQYEPDLSSFRLSYEKPR